MNKFIAFFCLCLFPISAEATDYCDVETALASYKTAMKRQALGDVEAAHKIFLDLAEQAIAPAQRHVAEYYLEESRDDSALENAIMWSQLAAWGGDLKAQQIVQRVIDSASHSVEKVGRDWATYWKPQQPDCTVPTHKDEGDDDFKTIGRFPVVRHEDVDEETFITFTERLREAVEIVDQTAPYFSSLIQLIPAFEIVEGKGTDRFVYWDEESGILQLSSGYLQDQTARQLSYMLVLSVQRHLFDNIKDAKFVDQIADAYGPVKIIGSLYGDVKTKRFISLFKDALKLAHKLPIVFYDKVNNLDEIYYMPPSRYHVSRLPSEKAYAVYDHKRSASDRRMAVFYHKVGFENAGEILIELVRLGTQAQQHMIIDSYRNKIGGKKREDAILKALEGNLDAAQSIFTQKASKQKELIEQWDEKGPDGIKRFYCEAVFSQIKAAIALNLEPNRVSRMVKMKNCKKAREAWKNRKAEKTEK